MRRLVLVLSICSVLGCGKEGDSYADAPQLMGERFTVTWGPVTVPAGLEDTQCIWMRLSNDAEIKVHQMHNRLNDASHHLIVYKDDQDMTE